MHIFALDYTSIKFICNGYPPVMVTRLQDEKMMFAAHTRESRDKWIFSLNKCCSSDSLECEYLFPLSIFASPFILQSSDMQSMIIN